MTIINSAGMALIATIHTIISDLSVSSARIHDAISIGNSSDTALNNVSANTSISINHCNRTTFNNIHLENVTSMHGIWIYMCVNTTFANTTLRQLSALVTDVADLPAVVVLYESSGVVFSHCHFSQNTISALKAVASYFTISTNLTFTNNTALQGATMILQQGSVMKLLENAFLLFAGNNATSVGGAIFVDNNAFYESPHSTVVLSSKCIFQTEEQRRELCLRITMLRVGVM